MAIDDEKITVSKMIMIYCRHKHASVGDLCEECRAIEKYAFQQLDRCRFGDAKPTCKKCPIHCYKPSLRREMQEIMRYSGPRMVIYHPMRTIKHLLHSIKKGLL